MLKELLDGLVDLSRAAQEVRVVKDTPEPAHRYRLALGGLVGPLLEAQPSPRDYVLHTLNDFATAVKRVLGQDKDNVDGADVLVFCGRGGVRASLGETAKRREWLRVELPESREFGTLKALAAQRPAMNHQALVKVLRIDLAGAVLPADLAVFRSLKFVKNVQASSEKQTGRDSLGRDVQIELKCDGKEPPDQIVLDVACYSDLAEAEHRHQVRCAVDTDLATETVTIIPVGGELERAQREMDAWIQAELVRLLEGTGVEVVCGRPA